jgi:hypothetical protein
MPRAVALAILVLVSADIPRAQSQKPANDSRQIDAFLAQLQRASQAGDRNAIAAMIRYPIIVGIGGLRVPFTDVAGFLARYDDIFTPALRDAIARGSSGVSVEMVDGQARITSITVPPPEESSAAVAPVDAPSGGARKQDPSTGLRAGPRRIAIRVGPRPTQIPGVLARDGADTMILYLPKGRLASVRLERVPVGAAVIRVVHATTGAPLAARPSADGRFVSGRPAENGDYRIEVRRTDKTGDAHLPYMLSLSLK